ncbi:MAG: response regulator [Chloroflexi bacterium]|nr:MAG: response regulator [Chloroflexota bacterium]
MNQKEACILVVDDNEMNRDLLSRRIERQGYQVMEADNGRSALDMLSNHAFDLICLDIMMPEMNGYQVLEVLKDHPQWSTIPVIVISAADEVSSIVKGIELGAEDYLTKPFNPKLLQARLQSSLERKRLYDKEQQQLKELEIMQQFDADLNATLNLRRVMQITLDWALREAGGDAGMMGTLVDDQIHVLASQGYSYEVTSEDGNILLPYEFPAADEAFRYKKVSYLTNTDGVGLLTRTHSQIAVPIMREAKIVAMLLLESMEPDFWEEKVPSFLRRMCSHAAIAIANAQLYEGMQMANEAKTEFISIVSHELKSPMTTIRGYTNLLMSENFGDVNETQAQFLQTMQANMGQMTRLVSDLEDISRIEAGQLYLNAQAVHVQELVNEVLQSTLSQIEEKEQTLDLDFQADLPKVMGDRTRLMQVFTNLINNAYKYTPENGRISIRAHQTMEKNGHREPKPMVHVAVEDTGMGIREEDQEAIFTKFFRGNDEEVLKIKGTGLGLNITKNLVELHNGRIWFESKHRRGTTFHVVIPAANSVKN